MKLLLRTGIEQHIPELVEICRTTNSVQMEPSYLIVSD